MEIGSCFGSVRKPAFGIIELGEEVGRRIHGLISEPIIENLEVSIVGLIPNTFYLFSKRPISLLFLSISKKRTKRNEYLVIPTVICSTRTLNSVILSINYIRILTIDRKG